MNALVPRKRRLLILIVIAVPAMIFAASQFWFENGNAILRFRSANGVGRYDVVNDQLTP